MLVNEGLGGGGTTLGSPQSPLLSARLLHPPSLHPSVCLPQTPALPPPDPVHPPGLRNPAQKAPPRGGHPQNGREGRQRTPLPPQQTNPLPQPPPLASPVSTCAGATGPGGLPGPPPHRCRPGVETLTCPPSPAPPWHQGTPPGCQHPPLHPLRPPPSLPNPTIDPAGGEALEIRPHWLN